jgi:hypothetical protein
MRALALWIAAGVAIAAALAAWWFFGRSTGPGHVPSGFESTGVALDSPDLQLAVSDVQGVVQGDLMRWSCLLACREPDGCHADIVVKVFYRSSTGLGRFAFDGIIDVEEGGTATMGGVQRPPDAVESVARVEVAVRRRFEPGEETEFTFQ